MATLSASTYRARAQRRTSEQHSRLDMTPMVYLAFVLLTFFMVTARPPVLQLTMPSVDNPANAQWGCLGGGMSGAMTIILGQKHQVHYYLGLNSPLDPSEPVPELASTDFSAQGIRQVLLAQRSQSPKLVVLIKPSPRATYRDMVDILDEMNITDQKRYALTNLSADDRELLLANGKQ
jgi:biopolymer transport protein ExbD